jgi:hypothetical protein
VTNAVHGRVFSHKETILRRLAMYAQNADIGGYSETILQATSETASDTPSRRNASRMTWRCCASISAALVEAGDCADRGEDHLGLAAEEFVDGGEQLDRDCDGAIARDAVEQSEEAGALSGVDTRAALRDERREVDNRETGA